MSKHTPGPWRIGTLGSVVSDHSIDGAPIGADDLEYYGGYLICESVTPSNARLIAVAPELLEELTKLANEAEGFLLLASPEEHGVTNMRVLRRKIDSARELIAKAEGS